MKKYLWIMAAALGLCSCTSSQIKISGRMSGTRSQTLYLQEYSPSGERLIDSATMSPKGDYQFSIKGDKKSPLLYHLVCDEERIPLLLQGGDRVVVSAIGNPARNYTVEGSEESNLLRGFYQSYLQGLLELDRLAHRYAQSQGVAREQALRAYSDEFLRIKREQLRFVVEHKESMATIYAIYQRLPGDPYLFNQESDVIYYRDVMEALSERYPTSPYIELLREEIERMEGLSDLLGRVEEISFPDLELSDMYGQKHRLSELKGKVILLEFWSAELGNSNPLNAELKTCYARYREKGFEIYQVGVDRSKAIWIEAIQEQQLPWISVSDLKGESSIACRLYNIQKLPTNFLINREGSIVAQDLRGEKLEQKIQSLL
uniref:thioredoxin-like domain-containing protein n=1 Tax=Alistipes sp. TaxID=1872444 RepID=UPI004056F775